MGTTDAPLHPLSHTVARDAMHHGVVACEPAATVVEVAALMAAHSIHCVVADGIVRGPGGGEHLVWSVVSDLDLTRAAVAGDLAAPARMIAGTEPVTVDSADDLLTVARTLAERGCSHAVVVEDERPVGVISTLDIARAIAE